ncbi:MAG: hypothetical protein KF757_04770 [Phycisphaeraceae bacterium]|nr:hypothetical protein [Phycisphaeraceae bacterium]MCW5763917.1 hypothetical protein [Phycisphaeraceae bacterium]
MSFSAGQTIKCTVKSEPRAEAPRKTIERLMRRDPDVVRGLKRAQELRRRRMHAYIRGGRMWYDREHPARIVRVETGRSWTMPYTPDLGKDLASVSSYLAIEAA